MPTGMWSWRHWINLELVGCKWKMQKLRKNFLNILILVSLCCLYLWVKKWLIQRLPGPLIKYLWLFVQQVQQFLVLSSDSSSILVTPVKIVTWNTPSYTHTLSFALQSFFIFKKCISFIFLCNCRFLARDPLARLCSQKRLTQKKYLPSR